MKVSPSLFTMLLAVLAVLASRAAAQATPEQEVGISVHSASGTTDAVLGWAQAAGISSMREEMLWSDIEQRPGVYALQGAAARTSGLFAGAHKLGMRPMVILGFGSPLHDRGGQPTSPAGRAAFAAYAAWTAQRVKADVPYLEVWNEWNLGSNSRPRVQSGSPESYVALLKETYAAVKAVNPDARILAGAMGGDAKGWPWLRAAIRAGLLAYADGVSVHLYNHAGPRAGGGVSEFLARIRELHEILVQAGGDKVPPIYITETGWPNHIGPGRIDPCASANRASRLLLELGSLGYVGGVWFYEFKDGGSNPFESEHNFGLLDSSNGEKPIARAVRRLLPWLRAARETRSFETGLVRARLVSTREGNLLALWLASADDRAAQKVRVQGHDLTLEGLESVCGEDWHDRVLARDVNGAQVLVTAEPLLLRIGAAGRVDGVAIDGRSPSVAGASAHGAPRN